MSTKSLSLLETMPTEMLLNILKQDLDITDLKTVRTLGRLWCSLASDDKLWKNIAKKINYKQKPLEGTSIINSVRSHVKTLITDARFYKINFVQGAYLRNYANEIFEKDSGLTIEKILQLKKEMVTEKKWNQVFNDPQSNMNLDQLVRVKNGFPRSLTPAV
ncbi:MAG: hypothetical protein K1060chlam4_01464 [Candidatus Anoxychlamydiales bacterium]|nr:hypothetical protein [Candidatus Anoxychlamydiales bacterium]